MSDPRYEAIGDPDVKLIEECAELIQAICKARRFGWGNHHPEKSPEHTNAHAVVEEMWDVAKRCRELRATLVKQGLLDNEHQSRSGGLSVVDLPGGGIRVETPSRTQRSQRIGRRRHDSCGCTRTSGCS